MTVQKLTRDQLAQLMLQKITTEVKSYSFDLFHDIQSIMNFAYKGEELRDAYGKYITDKLVSRTYYWAIKESGTHLIPMTETESIETVKQTFPILKEYRLTINANCDYFHGVEFAELEEIN